MGLHPEFPLSPHVILDPPLRWFPADEALRETTSDKLRPPLVPILRRKVKEFRDGDYVGATETSKSLLNWWFKTPHLLEQFGEPMSEFEYYFAQREALETIVYLIDVVGIRDKFDLMRFDSSGIASAQMFDETWRRLVVKMATGSGKTKVMSLALAWSYFHKLYEPDSDLARNFLVIAPNIIVLDRLYKDFQGLRIFFQDPVIPDNGFDGRNWRDDFQLTLHLQDEVRVSQPTGNIFLTNIHRVYSGEDIPPSPEDDDTMDYFLGKRPSGKTTDSKVDLGMIVRDIDELMIINDEAHHIHDPKMAWFKSIEDIHNRLLQKDDQLSLQIDVTATPKHNNGAIFVQTVADYPLVDTIKLRQTRPFVAKNQGYLVPKKSVFNKIIGDRGFELDFASFLESCDDNDVISFAKNYLAVQFKLDYVKTDGSISNYHPDFLVKIAPKKIVVVETKGLVDEEVPRKMERLKQWCEDINRVQSDLHYDFVYVDQQGFEKYQPKSFKALMESFTEYK